MVPASEAGTGHVSPAAVNVGEVCARGHLCYSVMGQAWGELHGGWPARC